MKRLSGTFKSVGGGLFTTCKADWLSVIKTEIGSPFKVSVSRPLPQVSSTTAIYKFAEFPAAGKEKFKKEI